MGVYRMFCALCGGKFSLNKMWLCLGLGSIISSQGKDELIGTYPTLDQ